MRRLFNPFSRYFHVISLNKLAALAISLSCFFLFTVNTQASSYIQGDTGYRLWLKYDPLPEEWQKQYKKRIKSWNILGKGSTEHVIRREFRASLSSLLGKEIPELSEIKRKQLIVISSIEQADQFNLAGEVADLSDSGYVIKTLDRGITAIASKTPVGALYGSFAFLRYLQTGQEIEELWVKDQPQLQIRVLNHWDNLDRHVERGYAGQSIWDWHKLPEYEYQRYHDYARANASIGINGTVLNNVNADPLILTDMYLEKVASLASTFRPYGLKVYLSVKFSSPQLIGGLKTSDPLDPAVQQWWKEKAKDIYQKIPDFGGFLVKANSEGQPGPGDFGRSHAEGANMLADALAPHGGIVMWRAFVYANEKNEERSKQAYSEFKPLDGQFRNNVLVQVKNGPIDFQPREPISPLFGATPSTPLMMEFQITQEYLGFSTHFVYLGTLFEEVLKTDTYAQGRGSTVASVIDGSLFSTPITGMAGVANIGTDVNWTGHIIGQANWYVFGRLAWNPYLDSEIIAENWTQMTLTREPHAASTIVDMMMNSRETTVNYMTPLGLHHIMAEGHHYGPGPWVKDLARDDWTSVYYHKADKTGIGFDRTSTGVNAIEQYPQPIQEQLEDPTTTPERFLLWFHHLPWDFKLKNDNTLWRELVTRYYQGAEEVKKMQSTWQTLAGTMDPLIHKQVAMSLDIQAKEARWWRDACVVYFQQFAQRPIPKGLRKPRKKLEYFESQKFPHAPGRGD